MHRVESSSNPGRLSGNSKAGSEKKNCQAVTSLAVGLWGQPATEWRGVSPTEGREWHQGKVGLPQPNAATTENCQTHLELAN